MNDDDFKLLRGFADRWTDRRTFVNVESLSRLKKVLIMICKTLALVDKCNGTHCSLTNVSSIILSNVSYHCSTLLSLFIIVFVCDIHVQYSTVCAQYSIAWLPCSSVSVV